MPYKDPEKYKAYQKEYRAKNKERHNERQREYYAAALEETRRKNRERNAAYRARHPDRIRARNKKNYHKNPEAHRARALQWAKDNPDKAAASASKRRATLRKQTIPLSEEHQKQIVRFYRVAALLRHYTKTDWHVDHIIPLRAEEAWGLHVPWNLQIVPAEFNLVKYNRLTYNHR